MAFKLQARHALPLLLSTICPYASWGCLFFFNDTATTEISPLSLHDPLPISVRQGLRHEPQGRERVRAWPHRRASADRKSTRLNSSHLVISYAVFCLKKKTARTP